MEHRERIVRQRRLCTALREAGVPTRQVVQFYQPGSVASPGRQDDVGMVQRHAPRRLRDRSRFGRQFIGAGELTADHQDARLKPERRGKPGHRTIRTREVDDVGRQLVGEAVVHDSDRNTSRTPEPRLAPARVHVTLAHGATQGFQREPELWRTRRVSAGHGHRQPVQK